MINSESSNDDSENNDGDSSSNNNSQGVSVSGKDGRLEVEVGFEDHDENSEVMKAELERMRIAKAKRGPLSASEVDRMMFNPQANWEDDHFFTGEKPK